MRKPLRYFAWKAIERAALGMCSACIAIRAGILTIIFLTVAEDAGERAEKAKWLA